MHRIGWSGPVVIAPLLMLSPRAVPADDAVHAWTAQTGCADPILAIGRAGAAADPTSLHAALGALQALHPLRADALGPPADVANANDAAHDAYFHVRRVGCRTPAVFVHATLTARRILMAEAVAGCGATPDSPWQVIDRALADLGGSLCGVPPGRLPAAVPRDDVLPDAAPALRRWIQGHQIFAVLTQGLLFSLQAMARSLRAGDTPRVLRWGELAISLLRGSGAAFVFTGSFSTADYVDVIRPSMTPPQAPLALSGLMSADHSHLVQTMREQRPVFKALGDLEPTLLQRLHHELAVVYDRHIHVCEAFVGHEPSLLTAGRTEQSGPELLGQFKTLRLKPMAPQARAHRLDASAPAVLPQRQSSTE